MTLYLSHTSALEYWRFCNREKRKRCRASLPFGTAQAHTAGAPKQTDLSALHPDALSFLSEPYHLLVPTAQHRRINNQTVCHVCTASLPEGSFIRATRDVLVASPELCCIQLAPTMPLSRLIELEYELCGSYRLPYGRKGNFVKASPAMSASSLRLFTGKVPGAHGVDILSKTLRYICDNSASPMETNLAELLVLDIRMGGYGIQKPLMNPRIDLRSNDQQLLPKSYFSPDLYWPESRLAAEYDSDEEHTKSWKIARDAVRRNGIEHLGIRVVTITKAQVMNLIELDRVSALIANALGKRTSNNQEKWRTKRIKLHDMLTSR